MSPLPYNYVKGRSCHAPTPHAMLRKKRQEYALAPTREELAVRFLGEVVAAVTSAGEFSEQSAALWEYIETLQPHRRMDDYRLDAVMPRPWPLPFLVSEVLLYSCFRAWLRKQGIDPDAVTPAHCSRPEQHE